MDERSPMGGSCDPALQKVTRTTTRSFDTLGMNFCMADVIRQRSYLKPSENPARRPKLEIEFAER
jgi:hypothetical protein